jgi:hypothetical protein
MTTGNAEEITREATSAPVEPKPATKARAAKQKPASATAKAKSGKKATAAKKANQSRQQEQAGEVPGMRPRREQDREGSGPAEAAGRRHPERADEGHRLAAAFGPGLSLRRPGKENGPDRHVCEARDGERVYSVPT